MSEARTLPAGGGGVVAPLTRRERVRADTVLEIRRTARRVLVEQGADGLALRAIAREMGMTAPALYRYFPSREALVEQVVIDLYDELTGSMEAARDAIEPPDPARRLIATSRAFRAWATTHHVEFGLLFGSAAAAPGPGAAVFGRQEGPVHEAGQRFGAICATLLTLVYLEQPFPIPAEEELTPELQEQLRTWCKELPIPLPLGVVYVFLHCWMRLYGMVAMEIFGHLRFALEDAEPMFEAELRSMAEQLGVGDRYEPPAS